MIENEYEVYTKDQLITYAESQDQDKREVLNLIYFKKRYRVQLKASLVLKSDIKVLNIYRGDIE